MAKKRNRKDREPEPADSAAQRIDGPRKRLVKYHRARIRKFLFTHGPDRITGGRLKQRHLAADIEVETPEVVLEKWPAAFDSLRIAHVSDFHLGELMPLERALSVVEQVAALEPDLIACTGDVVDLHHAGSRPLLEALAQAGARLGSLLVLGNHDELDDAEALATEATAAGMVVLRNEAVSLAHNGSHLIIGGVSWAKSGRLCKRYVDVTADESTHLLLSHNPRSFRRAAELGIPLTLAGHTHGGQIARRTQRGHNLAMGHRHSSGLYEVNGSRLYVSRGVGAWFPLRVNCPAEIALITVRSAYAMNSESESLPAP